MQTHAHRVKFKNASEDIQNKQKFSENTLNGQPIMQCCYVRSSVIKTIFQQL